MYTPSSSRTKKALFLFAIFLLLFVWLFIVVSTAHADGLIEVGNTVAMHHYPSTRPFTVTLLVGLLLALTTFYRHRFGKSRRS